MTFPVGPTTPSADPIDLLCIVTAHEEDVTANAAELRVTVEGSSLFTGRAALTKSREISALVQDLARAGVSEAAIALESVVATVSSGLLGRSSSARYDLRVAVKELETLPDVLGAVTGAKQVTLNEIVWRYPDGSDAQAAWLARCIAAANKKAKAAAAAMGATIVGVHRVREMKIGEQPMFAAQAYGPPLGGAMPYRGEQGRARVDMGFPLTQKKRDGVQVAVEYRIQGFAPTEG